MQEMRDAMKALGVYMSKDEVKQLMDTVDTDGNGFIDYDEFRKLIKEHIKNRNKEEEVIRAFRIYDEDDTGTIEFRDLRRIADELDMEGVTDEDIKAMIYEASHDYEGVVTLS